MAGAEREREREDRVAYYRLKKEARLEIPGQKSTISLNAAVLADAVGCSFSALGINNLDVHSRDLI